ncbi:Uncharacterized conserved protein, DUF924 family [Palleronia marisminoris]|uniref:DUF924 domain-containing protein n=2 Tax=Palleronia marisminoris TaxID=315423 RepID=A0A1Y5RLB7_9RHOB|nr:Uncharacterized conserved protein, DUF924 family [Palleronia marisminoris]SLN17371.1 hypothetical protein PAM7066_00515 [Palleronia marisminoris]
MTPDDVLAFWLDEVGPKGWYGGGEELDQTCRDRFGDLWAEATEGGLGLWLTYPSGVLAYVILTDQLPRNMWRGTAQSFQMDSAALAASKAAIGKGWDLKIDPPGRQFFYMPMMHSENLSDQDRCVRLFHTRMPEEEENILHAKAHREVIRRFGRFPYRNEALSRKTKPAEADFLADGGYGAVVRETRAAAA